MVEETLLESPKHYHLLSNKIILKELTNNFFYFSLNHTLVIIQDLFPSLFSLGCDCSVYDYKSQSDMCFGRQILFLNNNKNIKILLIP